MYNKTQEKIKNVEKKKQKNLHEEIEKCLKTSEQIDRIVKKIYKTVELTKMNATGEFKQFTEPKKNLDDLSNFYDIFIKSDDELNRIKGKNIKLKVIDEIIDNIEEVEGLYNIKENLLPYDKVIIVKKLLKENDKILENLVKEIENIFFENIGNNKDTVKLSKVANFLLEKSKIKSFLSRYSNELYNKVSFDKIKTDKTLLLKQTANIDKYIYDINIYNTKILGEKYGRNLNLGLNKILIINLTKIIGDNLQVIERDEKLENIPFLIELNNNLKHNDEKRIKDVESLFIFKDPINKIICNIFITYTDNVERLDSPNKYCDVEALALNLRRALDSMNSHKILTKVFLKSYGPMFKINTIYECNQIFTSILVNRILKFSESLPELKKFIYLINNLYALQIYITNELRSKIQEFSNNIVNTFTNELQKRNGDKLTSFINSNTAAFKSYYLPDEVRITVVSLIKKAIWEEIGKKDYKGEIETLNSSINDMFIGK